MVCTINGEEITTGTDTQLSTVSHTNDTSLVLLENNKVFIVHSYSSDSKIYGMVCTINGEEITVGIDKQLSNLTGITIYLSAVLLSINKILIAYTMHNEYMRVRVCNISGEEITLGSEVKLTSVIDTHNISLILLSENRVFIAYNGASNELRGSILSINGTVITAGSNTQISNLSFSGYQKSSILLPNNNIFITYGSSNKLYGKICNINGTVITAGTDVELSLRGNGKNTTILLSNNKIFIAYTTNFTTNNYLYGIVCTVDEEGITVGTENQLSNIETESLYLSTVLLSGNRVFITYGADTDISLYGIICTIDENIIDIVKSLADEIFGIAKTKGTEGQIVKVFIPKLAEYICTEDGNRIITENGEEIRNE